MNRMASVGSVGAPSNRPLALKEVRFGVSLRNRSYERPDERDGIRDFGSAGRCRRCDCLPGRQVGAEDYPGPLASGSPAGPGTEGRWPGASSVTPGALDVRAPMVASVGLGAALVNRSVGLKGVGVGVCLRG